MKHHTSAFFVFQEDKSSSGTSVPSWLTTRGPVLLKRNARSRRFDPLVEEVKLLQRNHRVCCHTSDSWLPKVSQGNPRTLPDNLEPERPYQIKSTSQSKTRDQPSTVISPVEDKRPLWHYGIEPYITYICQDHSRFFPSACNNLARLNNVASSATSRLRWQLFGLSVADSRLKSASTVLNECQADLFCSSLKSSSWI